MRLLLGFLASFPTSRLKYSISHVPVSAFSTLRLSTALLSNIGSTRQFESKSGKTYKLRASTPEDRNSMKELVESWHKRLYQQALGDSIAEEETKLFGSIYPEFYDVEEFSRVHGWVCAEASNPIDLLGTIGILRERDDLWYVSFFYVDERVRSEGLGRRLWNTAFEFIHESNQVYKRNAGYANVADAKVYLITAKDMNDKAYRFYVNEGFYETECDVSSPYCELVKLEKPLSAETT